MAFFICVRAFFIEICIFKHLVFDHKFTDVMTTSTENSQAKIDHSKFNDIEPLNT